MASTLYDKDYFAFVFSGDYNDGSHVIYVNGAYEGTDTPLGRLIHDFRCPRASDMLVPEFAARTRELKETEKGVREMSALWAKLREEENTESYNKGIAQGEAKGELKAYIGLVRDDLMAPSVAAARLHISESEFRAKCDAAPDNGL